MIVRANQGTAANGVARSLVLNVICSNVTDPFPVFVHEATATLEYTFEFRRPEACGAGCSSFVPPCSSKADSQVLACAQSYASKSPACGSSVKCSCDLLKEEEQCVAAANGGKSCAERDSMLDSIHSICGATCPACAGPMPCESSDLALLGDTITSLGQCASNASNADKVKCAEKAAGFIANTSALNEQCFEIAAFLESTKQTINYWTKNKN